MTLFSQSAYSMRVYVDGIFDLPHYGHQGAFQKAIEHAKDLFEKRGEKDTTIELIVGVTDLPASQMKTYKRASIYTLEEKMTTLRGFAGVHKVVPAPYLSMPEGFIEQHRIDLVLAGSDYRSPAQRDKYYSVPFKKGIFSTFPRTEGISTSDLLFRVSTYVVSVIEETLKVRQKTGVDHTQELETLGRFNQILKNWHQNAYKMDSQKR